MVIVKIVKVEVIVIVAMEVIIVIIVIIVLVPAKTPNSMDVKIGETHAIVQCLLWCPAVWGKSSRAKYHVVVAALTCCVSCLSCTAMRIVK